jgi:hypothetical protein
LGPRPRILVVSWYRWPSSARLAAALILGGVDVDVICPAFHPVQSLRGLSSRFRFNAFAPGESLAKAIEQSQPALIIPCDDVALLELDKLRRRGGLSVDSAIGHSLGDDCGYEILTSRTGLIEAATGAGVQCPPTMAIPNREALSDWLEEHGAPAFLKREGTFGGAGVRLVQDQQSAAAAFDTLARRPSVLEALRHILKRQELSKASAWLGRTQMRVSAQKGVPGVPANCSAFAWRGEVRAIVCVKVLRTTTTFGVATHVRSIENPSIQAAAVAIARRLGLTGVFGLDFILDEATGRTWLIELNARPTQISHMNYGPGRDLVEAIVCAVSGRPATERLALPIGAPIALFPHCLRSDGDADAGLEDLPLDQPGLVRAFTPLKARLGWSRRRRPSAQAAQGP